MKPVSRSEQETIISYDRESDEWRFYSDVPKHCRKWETRISPDRLERADNGELVLLEGVITHSHVTIAKNAVMSEENKAKSAARLRALRGEKQ